MYDRKTVEPSDVAALAYTGDKPILTLITCWPLGTSRYRLLIFGEQISPAYDLNLKQQNSTQDSTNQKMPDNEKTFFETIWGSRR